MSLLLPVHWPKQVKSMTSLRKGSIILLQGEGVNIPVNNSTNIREKPIKGAMFWLQSRNVCRFDLWYVNHVFTRLTLSLSDCMHHSLNYHYDDKLPFKIIEKVQLLENVFRGESTLSCSLLPIVLAMPPRLTLLGHIFYYPNHSQGHTVGIQHRHSPLLWNAADQWRLLSAQPKLGTERQPANTLLKPCSLMKELCWANICPLWI